MKVLIMNCSPVKNGATAEIVHIVDAIIEQYEWASIIISVAPSY